jgi:2-isopropylmalate synthase
LGFARPVALAYELRGGRCLASMKPDIELCDTTLRDGSQAEGINFSVLDKLRIAEKLDAFGIHYIEGGWPGSNPKDIEFFKQAASRKWKTARLVAFTMTRRKNTPVDKDELMRQVLEAHTPVVTVVGKSWLLHVTEVLRARPEENLTMIADSVRYFKAHGKLVIYDAEHAFDGFKDNPDYALSTWQAAAQAGAECVVLCDTNGGSLPREVSRVVETARSRLPVRVGIHTHNDCGLAVANALAAIEAGATHVQGTINGYGERTGNCNLITLIPILHFKLKRTCVPDNSLPKLKKLSEFVDEIANVRHDPRAPWVGEAAFAHKGGMHAHAVDRLARSYEHIAPEAVGNRRRVLVSELAGRTNILMKAAELGFRLQPDAPETRAITAEVKRRESLGYEYEAAEASLALLIRGILDHNPKLLFSVAGYHVSIRSNGRDSVVEATVKVRVGDQVAHTVAEGSGPVHALDTALRSALARFFPRLQSVSLTDYKVRILDGVAGTAARTRVLITSTDGKRTWSTVGVSENIITASLQALVDSLEYALLSK